MKNQDNRKFDRQYGWLVAAIVGLCFSSCGDSPSSTEEDAAEAMEKPPMSQDVSPTTAPSATGPEQAELPQVELTDEEIAEYAEYLQTDPATAKEVVAREMQLKEMLDTLSSTGGNESEVLTYLSASFEDLAAASPALEAGQTVNEESNLPDAFLELFPNGVTGGLYETQLLTGDLPWINDGVLADLRALIAAPQVLARKRPDVLFDFIAQRAKRLPSDHADFVFYYAAMTSLQEYPPIVGDGRENQWLSLQSSRNPIYRLLALKSARWVSDDEQELLDFYSSYRQEQDPVFHSAARDEINALNTEAGEQLLELFNDKDN